MLNLLPLLLRREVILPAVAIAAGFWIWHAGYDRGHARATEAAEARVAELRADLAERSRRLSDALVALEREHRDHAAEIERLEDDARDVDGADRLSLPADSVQRLRSRWGVEAALPPAALAPCRHPTEFFPAREMTQAQVEIATGRLGDALIRCGAEKAALAAWAAGVTEDLGE